MSSYNLIILPKLIDFLESKGIPFEVELWNAEYGIIPDIHWRFDESNFFDIMAFEQQFYSDISDISDTNSSPKVFTSHRHWQNSHPEEVQAIIDKYGPVKSQPSQELRKCFACNVDVFSPNL